MTTQQTNNPKIIQLESLLESRKDDPFVWYALGVEYKNESDFDKSKYYFEQCIKKFSGYVPAYLQFGMLLSDAGDIDDAKAILDVGVAKAEKEGNTHAAGEMRAVLDSL